MTDKELERVSNFYSLFLGKNEPQNDDWYLPVTSVLCLCRKDRDPQYPQSLLTIVLFPESYLPYSAFPTVAKDTSEWVSNELPHIFQLLPVDPMIFNTLQTLSSASIYYNPCHFHFCTTLVRWKCYFIFTKAHKTTIIRSIQRNSHTEPETEPSQA